MRRLMLAAALLLALPAQAADLTVTLTISSGLESRLERARLRANKQTCQAAPVALAATCTQAQIEALPSCAGTGLEEHPCNPGDRTVYANITAFSRALLREALRTRSAELVRAEGDDVKAQYEAANGGE